MWTVCLIGGVSPSEFGYYEGCRNIFRATYMISHSNILHLGMNIYAFEMLVRQMRKYNLADMTLWLSLPVAGILMTYGTEMELPTIGISGVVFFMFGVFSAYRYRTMWVGVLITAAFNLLCYLLGLRINVMIHLAGFCYGVVFYLTRLFISKLIKRYGTNQNNNRG